MFAKLCPLPLSLAVADKAFYDFSNQWLAGLQPQLSLETGPDGQIRISSRVVAENVPTSAKFVLRRPAEEVGPRHRPRPHGPSRQRRRLRREAAREAAAAGTAEKAVEKANTAVRTDDKEKDVHPSAEKDAQSLTNYSQVAPVEDLPAILQASHLHDQSDFWSVVDELCPDGVYHAAGQAVHLPQLPPDLQSTNIPQVDGQEEIGDREWWCYCCRYAKLFPTEKLLQQHHDEPDHFITYEECNICYPWHVWT